MAESIDLSSLSFDELIAFRERINLAIWDTEEWQEVTVPTGTWEIGKDIPAGHWTIKAADGVLCWIKYGDLLNESSNVNIRAKIYIDKIVISPNHTSYKPLEDNTEIDIDMKEVKNSPLNGSMGTYLTDRFTLCPPRFLPIPQWTGRQTASG